MRSYKPYTRKYTKKAPAKGLTPVQKKQVKTIINSNVESKYFTSSAAPQAVTNAGVLIPLSVPVQDVGANQRIGEEIMVQKLLFNFDCIASQASLGSWLAGDAYNNMRCIIFRWYADSGSYTPTMADVLDTTVLSYTYLAPYNQTRIGSGELHICYDKTFVLENTPYWNGSTTLFASGQSSIHNDLNHQIYGSKLGKKKITFNGANITSTNGVWLLMVSDSGATPHPYAQYSSVLHYTDA